jgi:hypothetical protein
MVERSANAAPVEAMIDAKSRSPKRKGDITDPRLS